MRAIKFTSFDDLTAEERRAVEGIGRQGFVAVREQRVAWSATD
jgi:hypothetical protein